MNLSILCLLVQRQDSKTLSAKLQPNKMAAFTLVSMQIVACLLYASYNKKLQLELLVTITKKANCKDVGILLQHINFFSPKKKVQRIDYWQHLYNDDFFRQLDRIFGAFSQKLWPLTSHFATLLRIDSQVSLPLLFNLWQKKCAIFSLSTGLLSRRM